MSVKISLPGIVRNTDIYTFGKPNGRFMKNTREHILDTAAKLFLQKSYHEVTMQDIVAATGLSKGAFYHYFSSKEKVFEEVINFFFNDSSDMDFSHLSSSSLWDFCQGYARMIAERIRQYNAKMGDTSGVLRANQYVLIFDAMKLLPGFRDHHHKVQQQEFQAWVTTIARARKSGEIKSSMEDSQLAKLFIYQSYGVGIYNVLHIQLEELTSEVSVQLRVLYDTLKP